MNHASTLPMLTTALLLGYVLHGLVGPDPIIARADAAAGIDESDISAGPWRVVPVTLSVENVNPDHGGGVAVYHTAIRYNQATGEAQNLNADQDPFGNDAVWRPIRAW